MTTQSTTAAPVANTKAGKVAAKAAQVAAEAETARIAAEAKANEPPPPPFIGGQPAPEAVVVTLSRDRIVGIDPDFVSIQRGFNVRDFGSVETIAHVADMKALIEANGLETPLDVRIIPDNGVDGLRVAVVRGETRLRAIREIRDEKGASAFASIPVRLAADKTEAEQAVDFIVSNSGKRLSMLETLDVLARLRAEGWEPKDCERALNFSRTAMKNLEILGWATPVIRDLLRASLLSPSHVVEALRDTNGEPEKVAAVEKKLEKQAERLKNAGLQVAKGRSATGEAREKKDGTIRTRETFNALVRAHQSCLAATVPKDFKALDLVALQKLVGRVRGFSMDALKNAGAPLVAPIVVTGGSKTKATASANGSTEGDAGDEGEGDGE